MSSQQLTEKQKSIDHIQYYNPSNRNTARCVIRKAFIGCDGCIMPPGHKHVEIENHFDYLCPLHKDSRPLRSCHEDVYRPPPDHSERTNRGHSERTNRGCPQCEANGYRLQVRESNSIVRNELTSTAPHAATSARSFKFEKPESASGRGDTGATHRTPWPPR